MVLQRNVRNVELNKLLYVQGIGASVVAAGPVSPLLTSVPLTGIYQKRIGMSDLHGKICKPF